jgi:hypothetical protein
MARIAATVVAGPPMTRRMVGRLLYAYARGIRSSRAIERACEEDVAFGVLAARQRPDHATIARFVERHERAIGGLFGEVLAPCARSGVAKVGVVAVDGTRPPANAGRAENRDDERIAREILEDARATDAAEDGLCGDGRGDELAEQLRAGEGRRAWLRAAKRRLEAERASEARPVPRSRPRRLEQAERGLEEELWAEVRADAACEQYRFWADEGRAAVRPPPGPDTPPATPDGGVNVGDPDARVVKACAGSFGATTPKPSPTRIGSSSRPKS